MTSPILVTGGTTTGLPWTTLRATQFHELFLTVAQELAKLPVSPVPAGFRIQPVEADEVAARLVELTLGEPSGLVPGMGGPQCTARRRCSAATFGPLSGGVGQSCLSGCRARPPARSGTAQTWRSLRASARKPRRIWCRSSPTPSRRSPR
jgi:hypothetical protein